LVRVRDYVDFDLAIEGQEGQYVARVLDSPSGQASAAFTLPFSPQELERFVLEMGPVGGAVRGTGVETPAGPEAVVSQAASAMSFGQRLYDAAFGGEVGTCFRRSVDEAERSGAGLRVRLRLGAAPGLVDVPWEYLYNQGLGRFVVTSTDTPLVRFLDLPSPARPLAVQPPLRVLVMISNPVDSVRLDVGREMELLREATADLVADGRVELVPMEDAGLQTLQQWLRRREFHVLHFLGHGGFDTKANDGVLVLEDEAQRSRMVSGDHLGTLLHDHRPLRLAVLNACEGARTSRQDPFSGVAQSLVRQGLPAVIAMQFEITDDAAKVFAHEFYLALADGYPVDAALGEARKAMYAAGQAVEWATPVLYLRASDGRLFDIKDTTAPATEVPVEAPPAEVPPVIPPPEAPPLETPRPEEAPPDLPPETPVPVPESPPGEPEPAGSTTRRALPRWAVPAGVAAAAIVVLAAGALLLRPTPPPVPSASPAPSPSVASSTGPVSIVPLRWTPMSGGDQFTTPFAQAAVAEHRGEVWVAGGEGSNRGLAAVTIFDPRREEWRPGPSIPIEVRHASLVSDGESLYLIGGFIHDPDTDDPAIRDVYLLAKPDGTWEKLSADLPKPRHSGAVAWDGQRIVFGGGAPDVGSRAAGSEVWAFNGSAWTLIDALQAPREHFAAATDGTGRVWFAGGIDVRTRAPSDAVDLVQATTVAPADPLQQARQGSGVIWTPATQLCVIGGSLDAPNVKPIDATYVASVECGIGQLPDLPQARYGSAAVVIGKVVYVVGGNDNQRSVTANDLMLTLRLP
jgi:CHAT domain-containing protein/Kelch motif protein